MAAPPPLPNPHSGFSSWAQRAHGPASKMAGIFPATPKAARMLALYHWEPNANSGKPMLALAEKGVEFESRYLDLLNLPAQA